MDERTWQDWCELAIRQTPEWKKFVKATAWMERRRQRVLRPEWDAEWQALVQRWEENVVAPLERKWKEMMDGYKAN